MSSDSAVLKSYEQRLTYTPQQPISNSLAHLQSEQDPWKVHRAHIPCLEGQWPRHQDTSQWPELWKGEFALHVGPCKSQPVTLMCRSRCDRCSGGKSSSD